MHDNYRFYNRRPDGKIEEDCVCRAISTATRLRYSAVQKLLRISAGINKCDKLCVCCYKYLLEDILGYEPRYCRSEATVADIAAAYSERIVLIRIDGHLTCSAMGVILDIWDCTEEPADRYWIIT